MYTKTSFAFNILSKRYTILKDLFNFCFFVVSLVLRIRFLSTGDTLSFQRSDLRQAFLQLYQEFAFKVACVIMIVANGIGEIQKLIQGIQTGRRLISHLKK